MKTLKQLAAAFQTKSSMKILGTGGTGFVDWEMMALR